MEPHTLAIVEDDVTMAMFLEEVCRLAQWRHVGTATTMAGGLQVLADHRPDCLVVDYKLDGEATGIDLIAAAKGRYPGLFTILLTAWDINDIATMIRGEQPDRILRKPVMAKTLVDVLGAIADSRD